MGDKKRVELPTTFDDTWQTFKQHQLIRISPTLSFYLAFLYILFGIGHIFQMPPQFGRIMIPLAFGSTAFYFSLYLTYKRFPRFWENRGHLACALISGVAGLNTVLHQALIPEPLLTTNYMVVAIGCGMFFYSIRLFVTMNSLLLVCWVGIVWRSGLNPQWIHFGFALLTISVFAVVNMIVRMRSQKAAFEMRKREARQNASMITSAKLAALGEMAGGIAHEINNPLAIISTWAQVLDKLASQDQVNVVQLRKATDTIQKTSQRIASIIKGLRNMSRDSERDPLESVPINNFIEDTLSLCRERFRNHGITLRIPELPEDLAVLGRSNQLAQILVNLLNNAYDALEADSQRDKWVEISVKDAEVSGKQFIQLTVTNNGPAISAESKEKLFQPFYTTKPAGKGVGLGLSVSRTLAESFGGNLLLTEDSGPVSFCLNLPKAELTPEERRRPRAA